MSRNSKSEKREVAEAAFMLGVNWTLNIISSHPDLWNFDSQDGEILRKKAQKIISTIGLELNQRSGEPSIQ